MAPLLSGYKNWYSHLLTWSNPSWSTTILIYTYFPNDAHRRRWLCECMEGWGVGSELSVLADLFVVYFPTINAAKYNAYQCYCHDCGTEGVCSCIRDVVGFFNEVYDLCLAQVAQNRFGSVLFNALWNLYRIVSQKCLKFLKMWFVDLVWVVAL